MLVRIPKRILTRKVCFSTWNNLSDWKIIAQSRIPRGEKERGWTRLYLGQRPTAANFLVWSIFATALLFCHWIRRSTYSRRKTRFLHTLLVLYLKGCTEKCAPILERLSLLWHTLKIPTKLPTNLFLAYGRYPDKDQ